LALELLSGSESPTAERMNELWTETDSIVLKALDGKSTYIIDHKTRSGGGDNLIRGKEFFFYTPENHTANKASPLYYILEAHKTAGNFQTIPPSYNQATYDTAANNAALSDIDSINKLVLSGEATSLDLDFSLKAHTRIIDGEPHFLWDRSPSPERYWRYCCAEIIIGDSTNGTFEFSNSFDKYNAFKIHNITPNYVEFYFGTITDHHYTITLPPWGQHCVRRDTVSDGYDSSFKYLFKCNEGDPRFLHFKSHAGYVADSMRANNITNASYIYNLIEVVGERGIESISNRITFDPHKYNDITDEYKKADYIPEITNQTLIGDLIFHKGKISYFRATTTSSIPEHGEIDFDGFDNFETNLAVKDLAATTGDKIINKETKIWTAPNHAVYYLWQKSTNVLTQNDIPRVLNVGSNGSTAILETDIYPPIVWKSSANNPEITNGIGTDIFNKINAAKINVADYIQIYQNSILNYGSSTNENIKLTTEGPILFASEHWNFSNNIESINLSRNIGGVVFQTGTVETGNTFFNGFNSNNYFDLNLNGSNKAQIDFATDRSIAYRLDGLESRAGWPSSRLKHHRMFEGPKHTKKYQNRGELYIHKDILNDPFGPNGIDFKLKDIGNVVDSNIAFQTVAIETKIEPINFDIITRRSPSYPLTLPGDVSHELETSKNVSSISEFETAKLGNDKLYIRVNLLKEHFNDMVTLIDRVTKLRPLCFDEVYFGDLNPAPSVKSVFLSGPLIMPKEAYAAFETNSSQESLYQRLGVPIKNYDSFPNDIYTRATNLDRIELEKYRWVSISDVKTRANQLGFKFRYEQQFFRLNVVWNVFLYADFFKSSISGDWKSPIIKPVLTSQSYIDAKTTHTVNDDGVIIGSFYNLLTIQLSNLGTGLYTDLFGNIVTPQGGTRLETVNFDANLCVLIYLYDDTRTESGPRAKFALKQIAEGFENSDDTLVELFEDEQTQTNASGQGVYYCQVTAPVTHSIIPVAVPSVAEENTNKYAGLHQIIFKK